MEARLCATAEDLSQSAAVPSGPAVRFLRALLMHEVPRQGMHVCEMRQHGSVSATAQLWLVGCAASPP